MGDRICSACGVSYTDDERHDYDKCYKTCEERVNTARRNLEDAWDCLEIAESRREAQRTGKIK